MSDLHNLHRDERFRDLFADPESPVYSEVKHLEEKLLRDRTITESERLYLQGKLAGILAVQGLVQAMFERIGREESRFADIQKRRGAVRPELSLLPRSLQGRGAFPAKRRAARGE